MPLVMLKKARRGDTFIEVMFALAIFSIVAIITLSTMSTGMNTGENSLELTVARNELNAQAEALRFIHSSYVAELTLPECQASDTITTKCQQYKALWEEITNDSEVMASSASIAASNRLTIDYPLTVCETAYDDSSSDSLAKHHAFVINTRQLLARNNLIGGSITYSNSDAIIRAASSSNPNNLFFPPQLNARIIYSVQTGMDSAEGGNNSTTGIQSLTDYTRVARVEGIWVIAVRESNNLSAKPTYYDFYIQACWNGSNSKSPTTINTIVRLYNPEEA